MKHRNVQLFPRKKDNPSISSVYTRNGSIYYLLHSDKKQTVHSEWRIWPSLNEIWKQWRESKSNLIENDYFMSNSKLRLKRNKYCFLFWFLFFLFVIYRRPNILFIIMNDPLVNTQSEIYRWTVVDQRIFLLGPIHKRRWL